MKKILSLFLIFALVITMLLATVSCGTEDDEDFDDEDIEEVEKDEEKSKKSDKDSEDEDSEDIKKVTNPEEITPDGEQGAEKTEFSILDLPRSTDITTTMGEKAVKVSNVEKKYIVKEANGYVYVNIDEPHMIISGLPFEKDNTLLKYFRLEDKNFKKYTENVQHLATHTAGVRVRFKTNTTSINVSVTLKNPDRMDHMPYTGALGCDVYVGSGANKQWVRCVRPSSSASANTYERTIDLPGGIKEVTIVLPLYSGIQTMSIGMAKNSIIDEPDPYIYEDPVLFYGSSITQGACASRPGMSYADIVTRMLGANLVNLGFSSGAHGEDIHAEAIAKVKMSAFIYDYDHNGTIDELKETHYRFYKKVRDAQPDIPIIMISRFSQGYSCTVEQAAERRAIIKATYDKAIADGDQNVYFIDGADVYPAEYRDFCLVDGTHPNDLGMYFVANAIYPVLKAALEKSYPDIKIPEVANAENFENTASEQNMAGK